MRIYVATTNKKLLGTATLAIAKVAANHGMGQFIYGCKVSGGQLNAGGVPKFNDSKQCGLKAADFEKWM